MQSIMGGCDHSSCCCCQRRFQCVFQSRWVSHNITWWCRLRMIHQDVTHLCNSTAEALSKVKGEQLSQRFRDIFFPDGQALRPGSYLRMPSLAGVLEAGLSNFYDGNFSQEIEDEVKDTHKLNWPGFHGQNYRVKLVFGLGLSTAT